MKTIEVTVQQENCDTVAITEMWWDNSHDWRAAVDGYKTLQKG